MVILWSFSFANEVGGQYTGEGAAAGTRRLQAIAKLEDLSRPTVGANCAKPACPGRPWSMSSASTSTTRTKAAATTALTKD